MTFVGRKTKAELKKRVRNNFAAWRLVLSGCGFDYNTVFNQMLPEEIEMANIALDMKIEAEKKAMKRKR